MNSLVNSVNFLKNLEMSNNFISEIKCELFSVAYDIKFNTNFEIIHSSLSLVWFLFFNWIK